MSLPRQVLPNRSYMITRRCTQRQFLLRPDPAINNAFIYCLAEAAQVHRIDILFAIAMSNHIHVGLHDSEGNYPLFIERFHKHLAKCVNAMRGRWENVFSSEQTSVVRLTEPDDIIDKMAYTHANPCAADLVEQASQWPGVSSVDAIIHGRSLTASRPSRFFRADGAMPKSVSLTFARPPGFENLTHEAFVARVKAPLEVKERTAAAIRQVTGKRVVGVKAILAQRWQHSPATKEARRKMSPTIAASSKWARSEALQRKRYFLREYAAALASFLARVVGALPAA